MTGKQNLILWIAAFVITFLAGYLHSITDATYPVSGTIYIASSPVYYRLEKIHRGKENFRIMIRTDPKDISAKVYWRVDATTIWASANFNSDSVFMKAEIPSLQIGNTYEYYCLVFSGNKEYRIPANNTIKLKIKGEIPALINFLYHIFLFGSLLFSTRTGLEYFNEKETKKKFTVITVLFLSFLFILTPLVRSYELGAINKYIPPFRELFLLNNSLMLAVWIAGMLLTFYQPQRKITVAVLSVITILIYLAIR